MVFLFLTFWEISVLFFIVATPVYILTKGAQGQGFCFSPHPHQHFFFLVFLIVVFLTHVRWHLIVVLVLISSCTCMPSLGKCLIRTSTHFKILGFLLLSCMSSLCTLDVNPLWDIWFINIFSHSVHCPFTLLIVSIAFTVPFWFDVLPLTYFCLFSFIAAFVFGISIKSAKIIAEACVQQRTTSVFF